ncbi:SpoIIE family protein phosphatase [Candidatus Ozemobacteraceae bacterium]|nr:SpoIIE family protein phosphatase [Candidatus Ozemobacteraceae bacterium]
MNRWSLVTRWIATCLVFFALPVLLVAYGLGIRWNTIEQESIEESYQLLDNALLTFRKRENTADLLGKLVSKLREVADRSNDRVGTLRRGIATLKKRFPGIFRFTITDSQGFIIPELTDGTPSKLLVKRLYEAVSKYPPEARPEDNENDVMRRKIAQMWSMFQTFIGREAPLARMNLHHRSLFEASFLEEGRWFGYTTTSKGGIFFHANHVPDWPLLALRDLMARFMKTRAARLGITVGIQDLNSQAPIPPDLALALGEYQRSTREHHLIGDKLFTVMPFTSTSRIWASRPRNVAVDFTQARLLFTAIATLLFGACTIISYLVMVRGVRFQFPIRWRLVVLFGFASGIPLAVVIFAGMDYLDQKYKARIRQTHDECERALRAFDARFPQMRGMMEITLGKLGSTCRTDGNNLARVRKVMEFFNRRYLSNNMVLYDAAGDVAIDLDKETGEEGRKARKMMGLVGAQVIANLNQEQYSGKIDTASLIMETLAHGENLATNLTREIGRILNLSLAGNETWMLMLPVKDSRGRVTHMMLAYWRKFALECVYLSKYLVPSQRSLPGLRIYGWNASEKNTPVDFPLAKRLAPLLSDLRLRQSTTIGQLTGLNQAWLATGIKPKELANHLLIGLVPKAPIIEEMKLLERRIWMFAGMIVVMSIFLGIHLSQRFLTPIGELATGVDAISQRKFSHRVPDAGQDELGDLARTFNGVMEGLADLEVAKIVQESLFPSNEVKAGEYAIYGESHTMTALGGDYYDLQQLPDGRVLLLVGDVSGHGVPAALVMAMAKALVERESEQPTTPEVILNVIHRVLFRTLKRKRMMTCFLAILDPSQNKMLYANAGHNYPVKFRAGEPPLFLELHGLPLGSMKKNQLTPAETDLLPGDRVVLYTDGIIEAKVGGQPIGYQRMSEEIALRLCDDARKSCERIFTWHRDLTADTTQEDDITLLVLTRASAPTTPESPQAPS